LYVYCECEYFGALNANEAIQFIRNIMALLGEMADVTDAQDECAISGDKMIQADTLAQPGYHSDTAVLIIDQTDFLAPAGFHNDSEAPATAENGSEAPASYENDSVAPASHQTDSEKPPWYMADAEAPDSYQNDSEVPDSYQNDSEAPESYQNDSEVLDSYQNNSEARDSYQNDSESPASYQTDSQPGSYQESFLNRPNSQRQNGSVTLLSSSLSPAGHGNGLIPLTHIHATSQANLSSQRLETKSTRFRSKDEGLEHTNFLLR